MECLDENVVQRLVQGQLEARAVAEVETHLDGCPDCHRLVALAVVSSPDPSSLSALTPRSWSGAPVGELPALQPVEAGRYELRGEIARGGMGVIHEAWDRRHGRRVAVKLLLRGDPKLAPRFVREAGIAARLQHPSIVPVYETGRWSDGEPFIAMKLVEGRSLAMALALRPGLPERLSLLPHLIAAADALAYAHAQGVLHRDLKPANVLLGQYGETVVIDWGLAKLVGEAEKSPVAETAAPSDDASLTAAGATLGTPGYMAPEQARGEPVDARADVYALGAILYHLLAGAPPYAAPDARSVLAMLRQGPPPPLVSRAPETPRDLAAIVERAMERSPERRYPTARELAEDLRRFTGGRLVSAHSYSLGALAQRWLARHRAAVAVGALALLALAGTAALSVRRIAVERKTALTQRDAAESLAQFMVGEFRKQLTALGRLDLLAGAASKVDEYYRAISTLTDANSAEALAQRAAALEMLAAAEWGRNDHPAALKRAQEAVELRERVVALSHGDREQRARMIEALLQVASEEYHLSKVADALATVRRAVDLANSLLAEDPRSTRAQLLTANAERDLAEQLAVHGDLATALQARRAQRDLLLRLTAAAPEDIELKKQLGLSLFDLGMTESAVSHIDEALATQQQALAIFDRLVAREPENAQLQDRQASASQLIGSLRYKRGELDESLRMINQALALRERVLQRDPTNAGYLRNITYTLSLLVRVYTETGRGKEAKAAALRQLEIREALAAKNPEAISSQRELVQSLQNVARVSIALGESSEALGWLRRALLLNQEIEKRDPTNSLFRWDRTETLLLEGRAELELKKLEPAQGSARAAAALTAELAAAEPGDLWGLGQRASARALLAEVAAARGELAEARSAALLSVADLDELWRLDDSHTQWLQSAPPAVRSCAKVLARAGDRTAARARLVATLASVDKLRAEGKLPGPQRPEIEGLKQDLQSLGAR